MKKYRLELNKLILFTICSVAIGFGICFLMEIVKLVQIYRTKTGFIAVLYTIPIIIYILLISFCILLLVRREVVLNSTFCKLRFGIMTRCIPYSDISTIEKLPIEDAYLHKPWDCGSKENKLVLILKNKERVYISVEDPSGFYSDISSSITSLS